MATWNGTKWTETAAEKREAKARALAELRRLVPRGSTVYTMTVHRSASGMMRVVKCWIVRKGELMHLSGLLCAAAGLRWNDTHYGVQVGGCGFSAEDDVVRDIAHALGYKSGKPSASGYSKPALTQRSIG